MDECDAALDTLVTGKIGNLISNQIKESNIKSQFIIVSHRPEIYTQANIICGIYSLNGFPQPLCIGFQ